MVVVESIAADFGDVSHEFEFSTAARQLNVGSHYSSSVATAHHFSASPKARRQLFRLFGVIKISFLEEVKRMSVSTSSSEGTTAAYCDGMCQS